jgi:hypothetical protein
MVTQIVSFINKKNANCNIDRIIFITETILMVGLKVC